MATETAKRWRARADYLPAAIAVFVYTVVILKTAWLSDDAQITFRTVDNFLHGQGLTSTIGERVQAYAHPLWVLLLAGVQGLTPEVFHDYMSILLCVVCSVAAVLLYAGRVASGALPALIGVMVFALSRAFTMYSTSGLENPLTYLLLTLFLLIYLARPASGKTLLWLSLLGALVTLSRLDALLLVLPALCVAFFQVRGLRSLGVLVLGLAPLIAWEAFALHYYGSLLPGAATAELSAGLGAGNLIGQGLLHLLATLKRDPLTAIVIAAGLAAPLITRQRRHLPLALGTLLYVLYVIGIGGDVMLGRYLTAPLLVAVVLLTRVTISTRTGLLMMLLIALIGLTPTRSPVSSYYEEYGPEGRHLIDEHGICDERAYYYHGTGLLVATHNARIPAFPLADQGRLARARRDPVVTADCIGMFGLYAGPNVHVVDKMALADPLLARLKPDTADGWRIGHLEREIPAGYLETLRTGENRLADDALAWYYDKLRLVTRGELWAPQRWLEIVKLNLGVYGRWLPDARP